jgi:hypothetical protein
LNARKALLATSLGLLATLTSCGTLKRAGKDVFVGVTSPYLILYGGAVDGSASAHGARVGLDSGGAIEVIAFPFTFLYHALEHTMYCAIHVIDLPFCPLYALTEIPKDSTPVQPLDFYQGTWFDSPKDSGTDATSGEKLPPGYDKH